MKKGVGQGQMEGCAGGGQGSKKAIVPLMMMMMTIMISHLTCYNFHVNSCL
jgi:hypothetical protein